VNASVIHCKWSCGSDGVRIYIVYVIRDECRKGLTDSSALSGLIFTRVCVYTRRHTSRFTLFLPTTMTTHKLIHHRTINSISSEHRELRVHVDCTAYCCSGRRNRTVAGMKYSDHIIYIYRMCIMICNRREMKLREVGEKCIMRSFITCTLLQV
jgi:hypothetical protein